MTESPLLRRKATTQNNKHHNRQIQTLSVTSGSDPRLLPETSFNANDSIAFLIGLK
jgi:hypothetical protein